MVRGWTLWRDCVFKSLYLRGCPLFHRLQTIERFFIWKGDLPGLQKKKEMGREGR